MTNNYLTFDTRAEAHIWANQLNAASRITDIRGEYAKPVYIPRRIGNGKTYGVYAHRYYMANAKNKIRSGYITEDIY